MQLHPDLVQIIRSFVMPHRTLAKTLTLSALSTGLYPSITLKVVRLIASANACRLRILKHYGVQFPQGDDGSRIIAARNKTVRHYRQHCLNRGGWAYKLAHEKYYPKPHLRARERKYLNKNYCLCIFGIITVMDYQAGELLENPEEYNPGDTITWGGRQNAAAKIQYEWCYPE